ncbi:MAG: ABC transporter ATP-binding protein [Hyphomonadaceae bacterium]|nr:ABC transporter ATP-binding protein [Hyphomonadaceae bacterium]MBC6411549.1 ABC transporter ATP-binding protein [Hyphomonadaceae bacterium]
MKPVLNIQNLTVSYGQHVVLDAVDLAINTGEIVGLIGPNGAGKSSLIKTLCGRIKPDDGHMNVGDVHLKHGRARRHLMGMVPQDIALYPHMTGRENLAAFGRMANVTGRELRDTIDKSLRAVGMTDKQNVRVGAMSGGMKRRINVAAAILHAPKLLIFDEPTTGVDIPARDTVHRLIKSLAERGLAILLVTHELEQVESLCDKICLLAEGKNLISGPPPDVLWQVYGPSRQTVIRLARSPEPEFIKALSGHGFEQAELPTVWQTFRNVKDVGIISRFLASTCTDKAIIREVLVRQPSLSTLMHHVEHTGELP